LPDEARQLGNDKWFTYTCGYQRGQRRRCEGDHGLQSQRSALARQRAAEALHAAEKVEATLDLQDEAIRRYEAYARRKALCAEGELLEGSWLLPDGGFDEVYTDPELGRSDGRSAGKTSAGWTRADCIRGRPDLLTNDM